MNIQSKIELFQGDITKLEIDAIINAANSFLLGGGGVDGAIHRAGGKQILDDCIKIRNRQGGCKVGEAVITSAGNLGEDTDTTAAIVGGLAGIYYSSQAFPKNWYDKLCRIDEIELLCKKLESKFNDL